MVYLRLEKCRKTIWLSTGAFSNSAASALLIWHFFQFFFKLRNSSHLNSFCPTNSHLQYYNWSFFIYNNPERTFWSNWIVMFIFVHLPLRSPYRFQLNFISKSICKHGLLPQKVGYIWAELRYGLDWSFN